MQQSFKRKINEYRAKFSLQGKQMLAQLISLQSNLELRGSFTQANLPQQVLKFAETPGDLYDIIREAEQSDLKMGDSYQFLFPVKLGKKSIFQSLRLEIKQLSSKQKEEMYIKRIKELENQVKTKGENQKTQKIEFCVNKHKLVQGHIGAQHLCDFCLQTNLIVSFRCKQCDIDICEKCIRYPPSILRFCHKDHILKPSTYKHIKNKPCKNCKKAFNKETNRVGFRCFRCDQNCCEDCIELQKSY